MPEISRFMGMVIQMYYDDHSEPHIHIRQTGNRCKINLDGNIVDGDLPLPKLHIVKRWIKLHLNELMKNWEKAKNGKQPERIEPWV